MIVYLEISSYRYIGLGRHYYGRLHCGNKHIDVTRKLGAPEAAVIRSQTGQKWPCAGDTSIAFHLEDDVVIRALQVWRDEFPEGILLIRGSAVYAEPQRALAGPLALMAEINAMYQRCEELGWWDTQVTEHEDEMLEICDRWDEIVKEA